MFHYRISIKRKLKALFSTVYRLLEDPQDKEIKKKMEDYTRKNEKIIAENQYKKAKEQQELLQQIEIEEKERIERRRAAIEEERLVRQQRQREREESLRLIAEGKRKALLKKKSTNNNGALLGSTIGTAAAIVHPNKANKAVSSQSSKQPPTIDKKPPATVLAYQPQLLSGSNLPAMNLPMPVAEKQGNAYDPITYKPTRFVFILLAFFTANNQLLTLSISESMKAGGFRLEVVSERAKSEALSSLFLHPIKP